MNKFEKIGLAISCFSPLYVILCLKNGVEIYNLHQCACHQQSDIVYNLVLVGLWSLLLIVSVLAILVFRKTFLAAQEKSSENVKIKYAENITSEHYFTYLSVFVLTFFAVDPTKLLDMVILCVLMVFIIIVYIKNEMWFDNPVLNLVGYKSYKIQYFKGQNVNEELCLDEVNVFSRENLNNLIGEPVKVTFSPYDFSVCFKDE